MTDYLNKSGLQRGSGRAWASTPGRLWLHAPASAIPARCRPRSARRSTRAISSPPRCCPATATSKAACSPDVRMNFLASPPLVVAYALKGSVTHRPHHRAASATSKRRQARLPQGHLADEHRGDRRHHLVHRQRRCTAPATPTCSRATTQVARHLDRGRRHLCVERRSRPMSPTRPISRAWTMTPKPVTDIIARAAAGDLRRSRSRPTTSRPPAAIKADSPAGEISARPQCDAGGLQLLRRAARPSRSDDARHLRQYPHPQRDDPRHRGRHDQVRADRRGDGDLRRRHEATRRTARRWSSSRARNMARARRATGRPRAPTCSASAPSSPRASSASTAPTWSAWACCRSSSRTASIARR